MKFYCHQQGTSKRGWQSANQSVSKASSQVTQSVGQAGGKKGKQKHTVWLFFPVVEYISTSGGTLLSPEQSAIEWWNICRTPQKSSVRFPAGDHWRGLTD